MGATVTIDSSQSEKNKGGASGGSKPQSIYLQLIKIKELEPGITNVELIERFLIPFNFNLIAKRILFEM